MNLPIWYDEEAADKLQEEFEHTEDRFGKRRAISELIAKVCEYNEAEIDPAQIRKRVKEEV